MSWDDYIKDLVAHEGVEEAGIYGLDGVKWASSPGMDIQPDQILKLAEPGLDMTQGGAMVGKIKCLFIKDDRTDEKSFCLHLKGSPADGRQNVCVGSTLKAIIIVIGSANSCLSPQVFKICEYLRKLGY